MPTPQGFARHFAACNQHDASHYLDFFIGDQRYGRMAKNLAAWLLNRGDDIFVAKGSSIALHDKYRDFESRSAALAMAQEAIAAHKGKKLRGEAFAVTLSLDAEPAAQIDRAAVTWFGVRGWGVHINGYVRKADGLYLWIGKRADDRPAEAGKLDTMVGGGQPFGISVEDNVCKEAMEEAGLSREIAQTATYVGEINYMLERPEGLRTDTLLMFDLELPEGVEPRNTDGEVAGFYLMPVQEIAEIIRTTNDFKFNIPLNIISFFMRHGIIDAAHPEYAELQRWLHSA